MTKPGNTPEAISDEDLVGVQDAGSRLAQQIGVILSSEGREPSKGVILSSEGAEPNLKKALTASDAGARGTSPRRPILALTDQSAQVGPVKPARSAPQLVRLAHHKTAPLAQHDPVHADQTMPAEHGLDTFGLMRQQASKDRMPA